MKKKSLLFLLSLTFCQLAIGQKLQVGVHSGIGKAQLSSFISDPTSGSTSEWLNSRTEGLSFSYYLFDRLGLCIEAEYTSKGLKYNGVGNKGFFYHIPLMLKHDFFENSKETMVMYAKFGPYFGAIHKQRLINFKLPQEYVEQFSQYNDQDFGLGLGLGAGFLLDKNIHLTTELRIERGLNSAFVSYSLLNKKDTHIAGWAILGLTYTFPSPYL